ncbi:PREDICTED: LOW QUALITY PROTEIN: interleukin-15 receptor subunit alpha, partial [Eurypyga helias]|uniref:LOW QUALITY PROTEIN: interleukin-15 receptor subunit alpha n=1 Tax=Eurypyga helias TaxID=54383 RepID=UPI000528BFF5
RCSRPKDVANAHIDAGNTTLVNTRLRYTCNPGYKRKAGTSSLIQKIAATSEPDWTQTTLRCIRDPALPPLTPSPELPTALRTERTTQRETSLISSPSPAATPRLPGAASRSPVPPAPDKPSPETSTLPGMSPSLPTSTPGEGTTPLSPAPGDHATVSIQTLAPSIGLSVLAVAGIVVCCCWRRRKMRMGQDYEVAMTAMPTGVAPATEDEEMLPPDVFPTG